MEARRHYSAPSPSSHCAAVCRGLAAYLQRTVLEQVRGLGVNQIHEELSPGMPLFKTGGSLELTEGKWVEKKGPRRTDLKGQDGRNKQDQQ